MKVPSVFLGSPFIRRAIASRSAFSVAGDTLTIYSPPSAARSMTAWTSSSWRCRAARRGGGSLVWSSRFSRVFFSVAQIGRCSGPMTLLAQRPGWHRSMTQILVATFSYSIFR